MSGSFSNISDAVLQQKDILKAINKKVITYGDLYYLTEKELFKRFDKCTGLRKLLNEFRMIKREDIKEIEIPNPKMKLLNPLVQNKRIL